MVWWAPTMQRWLVEAASHMGIQGQEPAKGASEVHGVPVRGAGDSLGAALCKCSSGGRTATLEHSEDEGPPASRPRAGDQIIAQAHRAPRVSSIAHKSRGKHTHTRVMCHVSAIDARSPSGFLIRSCAELPVDAPVEPEALTSFGFDFDPARGSGVVDGWMPFKVSEWPLRTSTIPKRPGPTVADPTGRRPTDPPTDPLRNDSPK